MALPQLTTKKNHIGIKTIEWDTCKKTFSVSSSLARHEKIYTGANHMSVIYVKRPSWKMVAWLSIREHIRIISRINVIFVKRISCKEQVQFYLIVLINVNLYKCDYCKKNSVRVIAQLSLREFLQEKSLMNGIFVRSHSVRVLVQLSIKDSFR